MVVTYGNGKDQPGKVAKPACGQLNRENVFWLSLDGFGSRAPRQPTHLHITHAESGAYLTGAHTLGPNIKKMGTKY